MNKSNPRLRVGGTNQAVLWAVAHLQGDGYGATICEQVELILGRELTLGGIYTALDRLTEQGFVEPRWGETAPARGGRRRQHFTVTSDGEKALTEVEASQNRMRQMNLSRNPVLERGIG